MPPPQFDAAAIPRFSVIRVRYRFDGDPVAEEKVFVVLCHRPPFAICIKATSKTTIYRNNPSMSKGCVWYGAGEVPCFPLETVIQPDNQFPIPYELIRKANHEGILDAYLLPAGFEDSLRAAIANSATLTRVKGRGFWQCCRQVSFVGLDPMTLLFTRTTRATPHRESADFAAEANRQSLAV